MAAVTFLNPGLRDKIVLDISPEEGRTLSSVMSQYQLREVCCGKGQCGSCAVKIAPQRADATPQSILLSKKEKRALLKRRKLSWSEFDAQTLNDMPSLWRLACQYVIRDEPILVAF